ncbi:MAG: glycosyltransferase family 4 protein [Patescibacteria group bacterium]|nr:glycosyltransferase family 4 protein [Patescibacteria group bacterium]
MTKKIALIANCPIAEGSMGGGDRALVEMSKVWQKSGMLATLFGPPEAYGICENNGFRTEFVKTSDFKPQSLGTVLTYLLRIAHDLFWSAGNFKNSFDFIYSASECLPDVILSLKLKADNPKASWAVGFYLKAPNPFLREITPSLKNILQFIQQQLSLFLMRVGRVSVVFVMGSPDKEYLIKKGFGKVVKTGAGVDLGFVKNIHEREKIYDACFVGRISAQKGVDDLLEVWQKVCRARPESKMAFIGWGHKGAADEYRKKIEAFGLSGNIVFLGFLDGEAKYQVVKSSRLSLFPSHYESFGIVLLESLAAGVPVVAYDLPILRDNFSEGVSYVPFGDTTAMAETVLNLLGRADLLLELSRNGRNLSEQFGWDKVGQKALEGLESI